MKISTLATLVITIVAIILTAMSVSADTPRLINYQGRLTSSSGQPVADATYQILFSIYSDSSVTITTPLWTELHNVSTNEGLFTVMLGSTSLFPQDAFAGTDRYLGITVGADPELYPRTRLVSVPYSLEAVRSDTSHFSTTVAVNAIGSQQILDGSIQFADVGQNAAAPGQIMKWNGTSWAPSTDLTGGTGSSSWTVIDSVIYTNNYWGLARGGANNALYGSGSDKATMVNWGVACTTGTPGNNYSQHVTIGGGIGNRASDSCTVISGGKNNTVDVWFSTISGGRDNTVNAPECFIGGGGGNSIIDIGSTIVGGFANAIGGKHSFIGGGLQNNIVSGGESSIVGGNQNEINISEGDEGSCFIGGGERNTITGNFYNVIGGGERNTIPGNFHNVICGGHNNTISGQESIIGGGSYHLVSGTNSAILGGYADTVDGNFSYLFGIGSRLSTDETFMVDVPNIWMKGSVLALSANGNAIAYIGSDASNPDHGQVSVYNSSGDYRAGMWVGGSGDGAVTTRGLNGYETIRLATVTDYRDNGYVSVADPTGAKAGMYVDASGNGIVWGDTKSARIPNPSQFDTDIWYACPEGPEAAAYFRGTGHLVGGSATITPPDHFLNVASSTGITVQVTPLSSDSKGLAVVKKGLDEIVVRELLDGTGTYDFDYTVMAVRQGHEDFRVIRPASEVR